MKRLYSPEVNYCLHLCGAFAGKALFGYYDELLSSLGKQIKCFSRMQLNVIGKTIFLTYDEAEAKLKKIKGEDK